MKMWSTTVFCKTIQKEFLCSWQIIIIIIVIFINANQMFSINLAFETYM